MLVKICGITNLDDARFALDAGADWIGLNLVAGPRRIEWPMAQRILSGLDDPSHAVVLMRVEKGRIDKALVAALRDHGVRRVQLYGDMALSAVSQLAQAGLASILVHHAAGDASLVSLSELLRACSTAKPSHLLVDAKTPNELGGTGQKTDWDALAGARTQGTDADWPPLILAGGLTPMNVGEAIEAVRPAGVDVSSGVEVRPGRKDPAKVSAFLAAVHGTRRIPPSRGM